MLSSWLLVLIILLVCLSCLLVYYYYYYQQSAKTSSMITYQKCVDNKGIVQGILHEVLKENSITPTLQLNYFDLYLPCNYTFCEQEIQQVMKLKWMNKYLMMIDGCDNLAGKNTLWKVVCDRYGRSMTSTLLPESYLLNNTDLELLRQQHSSYSRYIIKKNIQRKEGLQLTSKLEDILDAEQNGFVIVQKYINHVYCFNEHKVNFRCYVAMVGKPNKHLQSFLFQEGKCIYANQKYQIDSNNLEEQITSLHLKASKYDLFPLSFSSFEKHVPEWKTIFKKIQQKLKMICDTFIPYLWQDQQMRKNYCFQLFGVDVILDDKMEPYILEFNKGPSLIPINEEDHQLKKQLLQQFFSLVGILPFSSSLFIPLL